MVSLFAAEGDGGYAGAFLRMGIGARAIGMGDAFTSIADDGTAQYWNPAALGILNNVQITGMYGTLGYNQNLGFISGIIPFNRTIVDHLGSFSIGCQYLNIGNIDGRDVNGQPTGTFADNEMAILLSYGRALFNNILSIGVTTKYLNHSISNYSANGFSCDAALLSKPGSNLHLGIIAQDIYGFKKWNTESEHEDKIPTNIRGGVSYSIPLNRDAGSSYDSIDIGIAGFTKRITIALDFERNTEEESFRPKAGIEAYFLPFLGVRTGYNDGDLTAGLSVSLAPYLSGQKTTPYDIGFDYAFSTDEIANKHCFSLWFSMIPSSKKDIEKEEISEVVVSIKQEPEPNPEPDFSEWTLITYNGVDWDENYATNLSQRINAKFRAKQRKNYTAQSLNETEIRYPSNKIAYANFINIEYLENRGKPVLDESLDRTIKIIIGKDIIDLLP